MRQSAIRVTCVAAALAGGFILGEPAKPLQGQGANVGIGAVAGYKGGLDVLSGPYEVVPNWPKPLSSLPGHENWTWGAVQGVFAESPDRVFLLELGQLTKMDRPEVKTLTEVGRSLSFPVGQAPFRNASQGMVASPPGAGGPGADPEDPAQAWKGRMGIDARWEHTVVAFNATGDIVEHWTQWDKMLRRPHSVYINPYDAEKHVWIVDDHSHAIFKFTHDGKTLVQTIGTPNKAGADASHFNRPTFLTWLPDSTMFVADGYNGTRVAKFDKDGKFVTAWGTRGNGPGQFNVVHGIAADPVSRRVYVSDRGNKRMQVFDENGKFLDHWPFSPASNQQFLFISADRQLWAFDDTTSKIVRFDMQGHLLYTWGALGDYPGGLFNIHGASVDQEGNLYVVEVANGRVQKFRPRPIANPQF